MDPTHEAVGQSSNPRRRSHDEMEAQAESRPRKTVLDLYRLEQGPEEPLRRFVWKFLGFIVRIPPTDLQEISVITVFHANVRNPMMREKLRTRVGTPDYPSEVPLCLHQRSHDQCVAEHNQTGIKRTSMYIEKYTYLSEVINFNIYLQRNHQIARSPSLLP